MLNEVIYQGRTVNDIEERQTSTGKSVCSFTLAVGRNYKRDETDWIDCVAWGELAGTMARLIKKGTLIIVEGSTQTRTYEKEGKTHKVSECVVRNFYFCEKKQDSNYDKIVEAAGRNDSGYENADVDDFKEIPSEDDLPF